MENKDVIVEVPTLKVKGSNKDGGEK